MTSAFNVSPNDTTGNTDLSACRENLKQLCLIRAAVVTSEFLALLYLLYWKDVEIAKTQLYSALFFVALVTGLTYYRSRRPRPITDLEFFAHLLFDILSLIFIVYFSGGASNPFISYFLVPTCISAATLPWAYTWFIAASSVGAYTLLMFFHIPLPALSPHHGHSHPGALNLHIIGMWCNFTMSAILITYFVVRMANALRAQDKRLNAHKEDNLRNEQIMAVATQAAGTAHELGTPLSTMKVLLSEIEHDYADMPALQEDVQLIKKQLNTCKNTLKNLVENTEKKAGATPSFYDIHSYFDEVFDHWKLMRPNVVSNIDIKPETDGIEAYFPPTIEQSIINLLNNAADASPERIDATLSWTTENLQLTIRDYGAGVAPDIAEQLGKPFVSTKAKGLGLGLFLTHATMARYGGTVKLYSQEPGTLTELNLPITTKSSTH